MDPILDVFAGDAFSALELTAAISIVPPQYGRINQLGIFTEEGIPTTAAAIEFDNGVLNLIPSKPRGDTPHKNKSGKRSMKHFSIPHFPVDDKIYPSDVQNVREFATTQLRTPEAVVNKKLMELSKKHDITNEWLKSGAIRGKIYDADGTTILLDLFAEFNVSEVTCGFNFAAVDEAGIANVLAQCDTVVGSTEDELKGDTMAYVHALCSPGFWTAFVNHPAVRAAYANYTNMVNTVLGYAGAQANPLRNDVRKGFFFKGILWEEYRGKATYLNADGVTVTTNNFIPTDTARFFPIGTTETFRHYNAPADWMQTANTIGQPKYAQIVPEKGGRYWEVVTESNPLPLCLRPKLLIKGTK
jgi:hypothetical protein